MFANVDDKRRATEGSLTPYLVLDAVYLLVKVFNFSFKDITDILIMF